MMVLNSISVLYYHLGEGELLQDDEAKRPSLPKHALLALLHFGGLMLLQSRVHEVDYRTSRSVLVHVVGIVEIVSLNRFCLRPGGY